MVTWVVDGKSDQVTGEEVERFMLGALEHFSTAVHIRMDFLDSPPKLLVFYGPVDEAKPDIYVCQPGDIGKADQELRIYLKSQKPLQKPSK